MKRLAIVAALLLSTAGFAAQAELRISGIFGNLHFNEESGDLSGWEILVVPLGANTYTAIIQVAEGQGPTVVIGTLVAKGSQVTITVPKGSTFEGTYTGVITAKELLLDTPEGRETLLRGKSYWQ